MHPVTTRTRREGKISRLYPSTDKSNENGSYRDCVRSMTNRTRGEGKLSRLHPSSDKSNEQGSYRDCIHPMTNPTRKEVNETVCRVVCTSPIDLLLYNRPVKSRHFVADFAGNRFIGGGWVPEIGSWGGGDVP